MLRWLEKPLVIDDAFARCDAIVVLGAPLRSDRLSPILVERVDAAAQLFHAGGAPTVIATGGVTSGSIAEADAIAAALRARGVPHVLVERASRTTAENARFTAALLPHGATVWLVTQPFHGRRAARLFRAAGLSPRASGTSRTASSIAIADARCAGSSASTRRGASCYSVRSTSSIAGVPTSPSEIAIRPSVTP
jgi:uncharacterized SAM-binding protein YcdF (DUF218 family)